MKSLRKQTSTGARSPEASARGRLEQLEALEGRVLLSAGTGRTPLVSPRLDSGAISAGANLTAASPTTAATLAQFPVIDDGTSQRSRVRSISFTFEQPVTFAPSAFELYLLNTGYSGANDGSAPTDASAALGTPYVSTVGENWSTWTIPILPATAFSDDSGSLRDGIYTFTYRSEAVTLSDGTHPIAFNYNFHRLFGDTNGSKLVNNADYSFMRQALGKQTGDTGFNAALDFDGNGTINNADYAPFRQRFLKTFVYGAASLTSAPSTTVESLPPTVFAHVIDDGTGQRSRIRSLTVQFDLPATLEPGAFALALLNTGNSGANDGSAPTDATAALGTPITSDQGFTWTIPILPDTSFSDHAASLTDGVYSFTTHGNHVKAGVGYMAYDISFTFHRLFGDINGNQTVNNQDYGLMRQSFLKSTGESGFNAAFDLDNNGLVNNADFSQFHARFGKFFLYSN